MVKSPDIRWLIYPTLLPLLLIGCLQLGSVALSPEQLLQSFAQSEASLSTQQLILELRLPRILCALLIGAALGVAGLLLQSRSGNPLADPGILGINQGAALTVVLLLIIAPTARPELIPLAGLGGALLTTALLWWLGQRCQPIALLLIGIALSTLLAALTGLLLLVGEQQRLTMVLTWLSGSLAAASWNDVWLLSGALLPLLPLGIWLCFRADPCLLDPLSRRMLGVDHPWLNSLSLLLIATLAALAVSVAGAIGIIGYGFISSQFGFFANLGFIYLFYLLMKKLTGSWGETLVHWHKETFWSSNKRRNRTLAGLLLVLLVLILWQPQMRIRSQGIVESTRVTLYAPEDGFVTYVGYDQQRQLATMQTPLLLSLSSPELELTRQAYLAEQAAIRLQQTIALSEKEQAKNRQLLIELALIRDKLIQVDHQLSQLDIYPPPGHWQVESMPPESLKGRFFPKNGEILSLVAASERYIDVIVDQRDVYLLQTGHLGRIKLTGTPANIYQGKITTISPVATLEDVEQSFKVRMQLLPAANDSLAPLGLSGDALIFGEHQPLWRHIFHEIRKILRADLWL